MANAKQQHRQQLRATRNSIPIPQREAAANSLANKVENLDFYASAKNVALYWPHDDEINTLPLLTRMLEQHKHCYLPILLLDPHQKLAFAQYTPQTPLVKNRYGIPEPEVGFTTVINATDLDIIFVPLVGFDSSGRRLGRGGGFYDATFAEFQKKPRHKWPKLVGLAYSCQHIDEVPTDIWDWQLDAVVTESDIFRFK